MRLINWPNQQLFLQVISVKRMLEKLAQESVSSDFSPQEATIIREAKSKTALQFLAGIKQTRNAGIIQAERDLLNRWQTWACLMKSSMSLYS